MSTALDLAAYQRQRSLELILDGSNWTVATFGHVFVIALLAWILSGHFGWQRPTLWAAGLIGVLILQAALSSRMTRDPVTQLGDTAVRARLRQFTATAVLVGVGWAAAGLALFPLGDTELQLFLVFVMGGMSLSAVGTQHVYLPSCYASMGFAVPLLGVRYAIEGQWIETVLLLLYTAVLLRLARMLARFSMRTIELQYERDTLMQELTRRADDLELARRSAESANQAKSRFLAQASHDLRQPLHAIGLFVETISREQLDQRVSRVVDRIRESLGALSSLFDSLLDVNLLDSRQTQVKIETFALQELFDQLQKEFAPLAAEASVTLRIRPTSVLVTTDPLLLRRMLQNLLSNAVRYAPGRAVVMGVRRRAGGIAVCVVDQGPGMTAAEQRSVFEEFVRLGDRRGGDSVPGLGLGLSIVERLSRLLVHPVDVKSEPGRGSIFTVSSIPLGSAVTVSLKEADRSPSSDPLMGCRVLVIDDDPEVLDATAGLLIRWGCEVDRLSELPNRVNSADLIVSDDQLADGVSGLDWIIAQRSAGGPPALLITGNSSASVRSSASKAGIPLLQKPVRPVQLKSAMLHLLTELD